jgi:hypothetical protein
MKITTVGIDLAKTVFQIHGVDERGKAVRRQPPNSIRARGTSIPHSKAGYMVAISTCSPEAKRLLGKPGSVHIWFVGRFRCPNASLNQLLAGLANCIPSLSTAQLWHTQSESVAIRTCSTARCVRTRPVLFAMDTYFLPP